MQDNITYITWQKLASYGEYPHAKGLQRLLREDGEQVVNAFRSLWRRMTLSDVPVYVGHPDEETSASVDNAVYGKVFDFAARDDGLYALVGFSERGEQIALNGTYQYFSPRWELKRVAVGIYAPIKMISLGLTNTPNIPSTPIDTSEHPASIRQLLGIQSSQLLTELQSIRERADLWEYEGKDAVKRLRKLESEKQQPSLPCPLKMKSQTEGISQDIDPKGFIAKVHNRMETTGEDYSTAWKTTVKTKV
ncbi:MAG: hypothetical protein A2Y14_01815 [Verrucomicrobia bacterium GWF2_51_19]|nr:MAG: hypothetical protein A2Y14_01815 [Verrucomicrobia bacterium GWF2_51_19]HCJ11601.1 hypothetical protein [Opitutae bacterium]